MYLIGYDLGSSSVKASIVNAVSGETVATDFFPKKEMGMKSLQAGWAEQNTEMWWENLKLVTASVLSKSGVDSKDIKAIGISYQMHGLVLVDEKLQALRDSIIWCDSRAVPYGLQALKEL